ncbi:hypothetical protein OVA14_05555 [Agrococcus sp. SL85]|uniref:hypothetical protein n=1 Tax=Agrococcus sp. SL85 TaxID=2995141 RepID=UPI00226D3DC2|nr:hypothetical protein [Agrococcus sp. SL85]WAC67208.1 hypothetical protein OVA14_05555 [Agrococcus sp. SL85]
MLKHVRIPKQSELHHWADFVELRCLVDVDGRFSGERLLTAKKQGIDTGEGVAEAQDQSETDAIDQLLGSDGPQLGDLLVDFGAKADDDEVEPEADEEEDSFGRSAEVADNLDNWAKRIFVLLGERADSLGVAYPFDVDTPGMTIVSRDKDDMRRRYVFFLIASSLGRLDASPQARVPAEFERVSLQLLRIMLPVPFEIDHFGTAGRGGSRFDGGIFDRICQLADVLNGAVLCSRDTFHPKDNGDNGLDIVAWLPYADPGQGIASFFCQCACGIEWEPKQAEPAYNRWRRYIDLASPPATVVITPQYFRQYREHWYVDEEVSGILLDRLRCLRLTTETSELSEYERSVVEAVWKPHPDLG